MFKKLLAIFIPFIVMATALNIATPVHAEPFSGRNTAGNSEPCPDYLGLTSWDCGVEITDEASLTAGIWKIAANVAVDITVIAAYLVLGYVIYGGYLYTLSGGDPGKVATGKKTLAQAFIGLAIVMTANIIMGAIRIALIGNGGTIGNCVDSACVTPNQMIENLIQWVIGIAGVVALIFVVYGGVSYATSSGDPGKIQKAKQMIMYALIGLAIVALAEIITAFVSNIIRTANANAYYPTNSTIISKEVHHEKIN